MPKKTEFLEGIDENERVIGIAPRSEVHNKSRKKKLFHREAHVIVIDAATGKIWCQKRAAWKDVFPNKWEVGAAGNCLPGETPEQTAFRELNEELHLKPKKLFFLEKYVLKNPYEKLLAYLYWFKTTGKARKSSEAAAIKLLMPKEFGMLIRRGMVTSDAAKNFRIGRKKKLF